MAALEVVAVQGKDLKFAGLPPRASLLLVFVKDHPSSMHRGHMHFVFLRIQTSKAPGVNFESNKRMLVLKANNAGSAKTLGRHSFTCCPVEMGKETVYACRLQCFA